MRWEKLRLGSGNLKYGELEIWESRKIPKIEISTMKVRHAQDAGRVPNDKDEANFEIGCTVLIFVHVWNSRTNLTD